MELLSRRSLTRCGLGVALSVIATGFSASPSLAASQRSHLSVSTSLLTFDSTTLGDYSAPSSFALTNNGSSSDMIDLSTDAVFSGPTANDYVAAPGLDCPGNGTSTIVLAPGESCSVDVYFYPSAAGQGGDATLSIQGSADSGSGGVSLSLEGGGSVGYYEVDTRGAVFTNGDAISYGSASSTKLNSPVVGIASTGNDLGYWLVAADGGIFSYGDAQFYGSTGNIHLNKPIVGMAATPDGKGYWFVASDGGIFSYGDAQFYGSTGSIHLNKPIVGMTPTADGGGYWLVASDGGIFAYGDAQFYGSTGGIHLNQPIVGMTATPNGGGYWFVAADGGIFSYGDAQFYGARGGQNGTAPVIGMAAMPDGDGYWVATADGVAGMYGDAPALASNVVGVGSNTVVAIALDGGPVLQDTIGIAAIRSDFAVGIHPGQQSAAH
jgi:hypothetical protein